MQETEKVAQTAHDRATRLASLMNRQQRIQQQIRDLARELEDLDKEVDPLAEKVLEDLRSLPHDTAIQVDITDLDDRPIKKSFAIRESQGMIRIHPLVHSLRVLASSPTSGPSVVRTPQGLIRLDRACEVPCDGPCECNDGPPAGVVESFALPTGTR